MPPPRPPRSPCSPPLSCYPRSVRSAVAPYTSSSVVICTMSGRGTNRNLGRSVQNPGGSGGRGGGGAGGANDSYGSFGAGSNADDSFARAQDINQLHYLCETVSSLDAGPDGFSEREEAWDAIRQWLRTHTAEEARQAAELTGEYKTTALHLTCRNVPPVDVVDVLLSAAPDTVEWEDSFGWLPLHYACANGAPEEVLRILAEAYPESKIATDRRGRTPLHFLLGNTEHPPTAAAVVLLSSTGAPQCADENGMIPLHYACAYGASEEALHILTDGNEGSVTAPDKKKRTPLHFAMGNCDRPASPAVVRLLITQNRNVVNATEESGQLPLDLLATRALNLNEATQKEQCENAEKCLALYLEAEPRPTAGFLTALQALPEWLADRAVVHPIVQGLLNEKISLRFPTAIILLDFYFLCIVIITYSIRVNQAIECRFTCCETWTDPLPTNETCIVPSDERCQDSTNPSDCASHFTGASLSPLYIGATYFLIREVVQMMSLLSLGLFQTWLFDPTNWLDVTFIVLVYFWTVVMQTGSIDNNAFRTGTAISLLFLWINVLSFLKSMFIDFAVFVRGVLHVVQRLAAFLMALGVILIAFAQMFVTLFRQTPYCDDPCLSYLDPEFDETSVDDMTCEKPFCGSLWESFLKVYTMLLGEVDETLFEESKFALILFVIFMFLVVILLANVLIAIVTDSYGVIKNERAAIVFWSNRLDFVAEMDAIASGPWKKKVRKVIFLGQDESGSGAHAERDSSQEAWKKLMSLFEDDIQEYSILSMDFWCYFFLRILTACIIIPLWVVLGIGSAGWLWPPQVRAAFLVQRVSRRNPGDVKEAEQRTKDINELRKDVKTLQNEIVMEMTDDRDEVVSMKSQLGEMKGDVMNQMKEIKQVMTMLFDLSASS